MWVLRWAYGHTVVTCPQSAHYYCYWFMKSPTSMCMNWPVVVRVIQCCWPITDSSYCCGIRLSGMVTRGNTGVWRGRETTDRRHNMWFHTAECGLIGIAPVEFMCICLTRNCRLFLLVRLKLFYFADTAYFVAIIFLIAYFSSSFCIFIGHKFHYFYTILRN